MTTVLLIRHGRTTANAAGTLAGWTPGVFLDDVGEQQAQGLAERLMPVPLAAIVCSPLDRTMQTADALATGRPSAVTRHSDVRVGECDYGSWTGRSLKELAKEPLWQVVQQHPSAAVFPEGESMAAMQTRAVSAVREWNAALGSESVYAVVSHGDVIKAILADALGMHLDQFQRIQVDPCSVSVVQYTSTRPFVLRTNDTGGSFASFAHPKKARRRAKPRSGDAVVGGGAG
jgi:probable phosphomutase (TIGR03848 family)